MSSTNAQSGRPLIEDVLDHFGGDVVTPGSPTDNALAEAVPLNLGHPAPVAGTQPEGRAAKKTGQAAGTLFGGREERDG